MRSRCDNHTRCEECLLKSRKRGDWMGWRAYERRFGLRKRPISR